MALNAFTDRENRLGQLQKEDDLQDALITILQDMYPDDPTFRNGTLYTDKQITKTEDGKTVIPITGKTKIIAERNSKKVLSFNTTTKTYGRYKLNKMLPTIDEFDMDDLLDDEWEYFVDDALATAPKVNGLFVINKDISNPPDWHHMYLTRGPGMIDDRILSGEDEAKVIATTYCVFFIVNSVALPIPNYKTLEVMLTERDQTYSSISEATDDQIKEFDLNIDGRFSQDTDGTFDPYEEFRYRQMLDRSTRWDYRIRFKSGYTPGYDETGRKFYRDPGDYYIPVQIQRDSLQFAIKATERLSGKTKEERREIKKAKSIERAERKASLDKQDTRTFDSSPTNKIRGIGDPPPAQPQIDQRYNDLVFQAQTYREKLRERFEGKLMLLQWPAGEYDNESVQNETLDTDTIPIISDDKIFYVRMMINGYWKGVVDMTTFRQYALINNIDISGINIDRDKEIAGAASPPAYVSIRTDDDGIQTSEDTDLVSFVRGLGGIRTDDDGTPARRADGTNITYFSSNSNSNRVIPSDARLTLVDSEASATNNIFQGIIPSSFSEIVGGSFAAGFIMDGLYGADGIINQLVQNGGATVIQDDYVIVDDMAEAVRLVQENVIKQNNAVIRPDGIYEATNNELLYSNEEWLMLEKKVINEIKSPAWSDFSHIVEVDRLDSPEYEQYLDYYSNGGSPFDIDYLQPYEPAGSIHYYPKEQLDKLYQQAKDQASVDTIKKQITEMLPGLVSRATDLDERFKAQPDSYSEYCVQMLGPDSPLYQIMHSDGSQFDFFKKRRNKKKRKNKGDKHKGSNSSFLRLLEKENKIFRKFNKTQEDEIMFGGGRDWWRSVGKEDQLLDFLRTYEKFIPTKWLFSIDKDGFGYSDAGLIEKTNNIIDNVDSKIDNTTANIVGKVDNLGNNIADSVENLGDRLGNTVESLGDNISGVDIPDIGTMPEDGKFENINSTINNGLGKVNRLTGNIDSGIDNVGSSISDLGGDIADQLDGQSVTNISDSIETGISNFGDNVSDAATGIIQGASEVIGDAMLKLANIKNPVKIGGVTSDFNHHDRKGMPRLDGGDRRARKLLKRYNYTKLCTGAYMVINKIRPEACGLLDEAGNAVSVYDKAVDLNDQFKLYRGQIDAAISSIGTIDARLMSSTKAAEFQSIYDDLQQIEDDFDNIDLTVFKQGENLKEVIDGIQQHMANQLYSAIQYVRGRIWSKTNDKFYIKWSTGAKDAMEACVPNKTFNNYQPDDI
jgi:hypothetical protein